MILGNPAPDTYIPLAQLINCFKVDCSKVHLVAEDDCADQNGPFTPYLPSTMLQTKKTQVCISEELAAPFECREMGIKQLTLCIC